MARNRKNQSAGMLFGPALKASLICLFIVICCVGYVWQKRQIADLSQQIRMAEKRLKSMQNNNDKLRVQLADLLSPPALAERAKQLKLGLGLPQPNQIWRLPEPVSDTPAMAREREYVPAGQAPMLGLP